MRLLVDRSRQDGLSRRSPVRPWIPTRWARCDGGCAEPPTTGVRCSPMAVRFYPRHVDTGATMRNRRGSGRRWIFPGVNRLRHLIHTMAYGGHSASPEQATFQRPRHRRRRHLIERLRALERGIRDRFSNRWLGRILLMSLGTHGEDSGSSSATALLDRPSGEHDADDGEDADKIRHKAEELFRTLPPEIQDPATRDRQEQVVWSSRLKYTYELFVYQHSRRRK